jgi:hypothetical protein
VDVDAAADEVDATPEEPTVTDDEEETPPTGQFEAIKEDVKKRQAEKDEDEEEEKRSRSKEDEEEASTEEIEKIWSILEDME